MPAVEQESRGQKGRGSPKAFGAVLSRTGIRRGEPVWSGRGVLAVAAATIVAGLIVRAIMAGAGGDALRVAAVFIALGALLLAMPANRWIAGLVALVASWSIAVIAVRYLPDVINPGPPVGQAVGGAAFFDTPYRGAQIAAVLSVALPAALAFGAFVLARLGPPRVPRRRRDGCVTAPPSRPASARSGPMWIGAAILAFTLVPDLRSYLHHAGDPQSYSWDVSNVTSWQLFAQMGLVPMKDFFYPYGFQWLYTLGTAGPVIQWAAQTATLAVAGWSLWRLSGGRTWRVLGCLLCAVLIGQWGIEAWRYMPALFLTTAYAALGPGAHQRFVRGHLVFFAACLLALFVGADVLLTGLVGALLVLVGEVVAGRVHLQLRRLSLGLLIDAVPVGASLLLILLVWVSIGTATGNLRFLTDVSAVSSGSALDERAYGPLGLMTLHPNAYSLYAALPALLAAIGFLWARLERRTELSIAPILLGASGVSLTMLLKHFVRPINDYVLIAPLVALSWSAILAWRRESIVRAAACGAALGALISILNSTGVSLSQYLSSAVASPVHAARSVLTVFDPGAALRADEASVDPGRFLAWPDTAITGEYLATAGGLPIPSFAIVGDSQLTYAMLHQAPPYQAELYDASPIAEQHAMTAVLLRRHPAYVIWRKDFFQDGVLYDVRDPLVFRWMIENYVPVRVGPTVDILRRRRPGEALPGAFWRSQLGGTEDLGFIPSFSSAAGSPACIGGAGCVAYALVQGRATTTNPGVGLVVSGRGVEYGVTLRIRPGVHAYPVRLDRLWFSTLVGPRPTLRSLTPGFTLRLVGRRSGDNLY